MIASVLLALAIVAGETPASDTAHVREPVVKARPEPEPKPMAQPSPNLPPAPMAQPKPNLPPAPMQTPSAGATSSVPSYWQTRAERTGYKQTSTYDELIRSLRALQTTSSWVKLETYGTSGQGRELPLLIVSKDKAFTPELAQKTGKPIILIQNGIHSGEIEGKDATSALVRDMTLLHRNDKLLDHVILLVLPIFSVDAHERRSRYNRINQNGPEEMGWRSTPIGLNLNRDYLKVETPEMRALISKVYTKWWPHLLVDNHTTDGADYRHDVTYGFNHGPGTPTAISNWFESCFEGRVVPRLAALGHLPAPYINFRTGNDPTSGIPFDNSTPRFSTGYGPLQCRAALLVETHMLKPYETRVKATYDLMQALLEEINAHPDSLVNAVKQAEAEVVARGRQADPAKREVVLSSETTGNSVPFPFKGYVTNWEFSEITASRVPRYTTTPWDTVIPLFRELKPKLTVRQPVGYLVPREWTIARDKLDIHGVKYRLFTKPWGDTVEVQHVNDWSWSALPSEGHRPVSVKSVTLVRRYREFRAGDLWVPLDQPGAMIAVHLFEAQGPDGLVYWNAFDTVFEKKEYGEDYVVEPMARKMMAENPALKTEFEARVRADTSFAKSPQQRSDFFYRRSPWADPGQDDDPVVRALHAPPATVLAP
jgi:murein tripeptide amidase MpaA